MKFIRGSFLPPKNRVNTEAGTSMLTSVDLASPLDLFLPELEELPSASSSLSEELDEDDEFWELDELGEL